MSYYDDWLDTQDFDSIIQLRKHLEKSLSSPSMTIKLKNVRLSFPSLFKARKFSDDSEGDPKYSATFILNKTDNAKAITRIEEGIAAVLDEKYGPGKYKLTKFKVALRDGDEKPDTDGYGEEVMFISANSKNRVPVVDRDLTPLSEEEGKPYAGCYVNCTIRLWVQDNKWGKRVNAALRAVQFLKDGEPFGEKPADATEEFEDLGSEPEEDEDKPKVKSGKKSPL